MDKTYSGRSQLKPEPLVFQCQKLWYRMKMKHIGRPTISDVPCTVIVHSEVLFHKFCLCSVNTTL